jgi:hypothetical protein
MVGGGRYLSGRIQFEETEARDRDLWPSAALKRKSQGNSQPLLPQGHRITLPHLIPRILSTDDKMSRNQPNDDPLSIDLVEALRTGSLFF